MSELISALYQTVYYGASRVVKKVQKTLPCYILKNKSGTVSDTALISYYLLFKHSVDCFFDVYLRLVYGFVHPINPYRFRCGCVQFVKR